MRKHDDDGPGNGKQWSEWSVRPGATRFGIGEGGLGTSLIVLFLPVAPMRQLAFSQDGLLIQATQLLAEGAYDRASQKLVLEVKAHPEDGNAHLLLGQIYTIQGRRGEAIQELRRTIELEPQSASAYEMLGTVLSRFAEFDAAQKVFEQAVAPDPQMAEARIDLAMTLAESGDLKSARSQLLSAIELQPAAPAAARAHYLLAKIYEEQDNIHAVDELIKSSELNPRDEQTWLELGRIRSESGDETAALEAFRRAVSCDPQDAEAQYELGSEYLMQGDSIGADGYSENASGAFSLVRKFFAAT